MGLQLKECVHFVSCVDPNFRGYLSKLTNPDKRQLKQCVLVLSSVLILISEGTLLN